MKIAKVQSKGEVFYGIVEEDRIRRIDGDIFGDYKLTQSSIGLSEVRLLPPVSPPNIIAIGLNYKEHADESNMKASGRPVVFLKATNSLVAHGDYIILPETAPDEVDYEGEMAIVIGKKAKNVREAEALDFVLGYTCANDVSARDCQLRLDSQWARGKSFDTFCPLGPWISTDINPDDRPIRTMLNGEVLQSSNTADMIFSVSQLVSYCSRDTTLLPGTVILSGTPKGVGFARKPPVFLKAGDVVEIEIEGIGVLKNFVAAC